MRKSNTEANAVIRTDFPSKFFLNLFMFSASEMRSRWLLMNSVNCTSISGTESHCSSAYGIIVMPLATK